MNNTRAATLKDIDQLSILFDEYRVFYEKPSDTEGAKKFLEERISRNESVIYLIESEDKLLTGFVQLYPLFSSTRMQRLWLLNDLYVIPSHRGRGLSIALIEKAKELCRQTQACGLMLETAKTNNVGNKLYPATNFVLDEGHNYYYWEV